MTMLHVETLSRISYTIYNTAVSVFDPQRSVLGALLEGRSSFVVVDESVMSLYGAPLRAYLARQRNVVGCVTLPGVETAKTWSSVEGVCEAVLESGLDRRGVIVGIGGGIVLDIVGFAASMYRRGVPYVRVPTTLIGMVDVAVGIKHGVNFGAKKNLLGSFYPTMAAVVDSAFLRTLAPRHIAGGLAEIIKIALVCDRRLFELVEIAPAVLCASRFGEPRDIAEEIIVASQAAMIEELEANLYERDLQRLADFGHAFSPTLETASGYELSHGEAVAIDMLLSTAIATNRGLCDSSIFLRLYDLCRAVGLPVSHPVITTSLLARSLRETRIQRGNQLSLVVPTGLGSGTFLQNVTEGELTAALASIASR